MSMDNCDGCGAYVNSDDDPSCYVTIAKTMTVCLCEHCREEREQEDAEPEKDEPHVPSVGEVRDHVRERDEANAYFAATEKDWP